MPPLTEPDTTGLPPQLKAIAEEHVALKRSITTVQDELKTVKDAGGSPDLVNRLSELEKSLVKFDGEFRGMASRIAGIDTLRNMDEKDVKRFSMARCATALGAAHMRRKDPADPDIWKTLAPFEFDVIQDTEKQASEQRTWVDKAFGRDPNPRSAEVQRDMTSVADASGAILVPTPAAMNHLDYLRPYLPLIPLGARVRGDCVGLRVPIDTSTTSGVTAYWVGENATPTKSDIGFAINYATPKRLAARTHISNLLLRNSLGEVRNRVEADMPRAMAYAMEYAALFGAGTAFTPKGLEKHLEAGSYQSTIGADSTHGGRFRYKHIVDMQRRIFQRNVAMNPATTGLLIHCLVESLLRTQGVEQFSAQGEDLGQPILAPYGNVAALKEILGRYEVSNIVPIDRAKTETDLSVAIYGDWSQLNLCQWGGYRMRASDVASDGTNHAFVQDFTFLIIEGEFDSLPSRPEAFHEYTDVKTTA